MKNLKTGALGDSFTRRAVLRLQPPSGGLWALLARSISPLRCFGFPLLAAANQLPALDPPRGRARVEVEGDMVGKGAELGGTQGRNCWKARGDPWRPGWRGQGFRGE